MTKKERIKELEKRNFEIEETIRFLLKDREKHLQSWERVSKDMERFQSNFEVVHENFKTQSEFNLKQKTFNDAFLALLDAKN